MVDTKVEVYNLAIDIIKDTALQTDTDNAATARWLNRNFAHTVETTLRAYVWNFAKEEMSLSEDPDTPAFKWNHRYKKPAKVLRILPPTAYSHRRGRPVPHELVGEYIHTDATSPFTFTAIVNVQDPSKWDPLFTEIVRCKLALGMANKFTSKNKFIELASQMLRTAVEQAELIDALEGSAEPVEEFDILRVRGFGYDNDRGSY